MSAIPSEMTPLDSSPYSYHFLVLKFLGFWVYDSEKIAVENQTKRNAFTLYRATGTMLLLYGMSSLCLDLYAVLGDMKKVTWNLCVSILLAGAVCKNAVMAARHDVVNALRLMLHRDAQSRHTPEDLSINDSALKEMKKMKVAFYAAAVIFIPTWIVARYIARELPIPFTIPDFIDLDDDVQFLVIYVLLACGGVFGMMMTMETELAMYALLIQISREYKVLLKDIREIDKLYDNDDEEWECLGSTDNSHNLKFYFTRKEVNPVLKRIKTKMLVKKFSKRQATLIKYTEAFEVVFNQPLLQQFFGISILIISLALQLLWESVDFSGNLLYQMGYLYINIMDLFMMCLYSTRIRTQCLDVGQTFYSTLWYKMSTEVQRDVAMMIMRSQRPPRITTGKFMELSLSAFMHIMSNLYSWLALFRQLE